MFSVKFQMMFKDPDCHTKELYMCNSVDFLQTNLTNSYIPTGLIAVLCGLMSSYD